MTIMKHSDRLPDVPMPTKAADAAVKADPESSKAAPKGKSRAQQKVKQKVLKKILKWLLNLATTTNGLKTTAGILYQKARRKWKLVAVVTVLRHELKVV